MGVGHDAGPDRRCSRRRAYGFGSLLRGSDVIINEVAIVRGAPGATDGTAQVYLGVFSPARSTYQVRVPGGALLSSPISGDFFGGDGTAAPLDVLQGDPARVRDLAVGFGSLRTIRAETRGRGAARPGRPASSRTDASRGPSRTPRTRRFSSRPWSSAGPSPCWATWRRAPRPPSTSSCRPFQMGQQLSDKIVGPVFFGDPSQMGDDANRLYARHTIVDQLTFDPNLGFTGQLPADGPVVLAWADRELLPVEIEGQSPGGPATSSGSCRRTSRISGTTTFRSDLLRSTVISSDAAFFSKDPFSINFGRGTAELAYRPIAFEGTIDATQLAIGLNFGDPGFVVDPKPIEPLPTIPPPCDEQPDACEPNQNFDGLPEVELYDLDAGDWERLPHLDGRLPIRHRRAGALRRSGDRDGPHPVRERQSPMASGSASTWRSPGTLQ